MVMAMIGSVVATRHLYLIDMATSEKWVFRRSNRYDHMSSVSSRETETLTFFSIKFVKRILFFFVRDISIDALATTTAQRIRNCEVTAHTST